MIQRLTDNLSAIAAHASRLAPEAQETLADALEGVLRAVDAGIMIASNEEVGLQIGPISLRGKPLDFLRKLNKLAPPLKTGVVKK